MRIRIIAVGKLKEPHFKAALQEYATRLIPYAQLEVVEIKDEPLPEIGDAPGEAEAKAREGQRLLAALQQGPAREYRVALEVGGREYSSEDLADLIRTVSGSGTSNIAFIIGGAAGLAPEITRLADLKFSLSRLTFPHQLVRVMLLEQIYRAFKIMRNEPYHR